jgi:RNA-directed DNA polymerase
VSRFGNVRGKASPFAPSLRDYREDRRNRRARGQGKPGTFAFLGFTHIFGRTREGRRLIRRHTVREQLNPKLGQVKATLLAGLLVVFLVTLAGWRSP